MRRIRVHKPGGYGRLVLEDAPDPPIAPGEVRISVDAIGVNYADCIVRMGLYASARELVGWPITPGFEVAGRVETVGRGVSSRKAGDRVIAVTRFGGYATSIVVPEHQTFAIPDGWSMPSAAGFSVAFLTAYYALIELAHPRKGATILVHSAAGGVGGALLQLARAKGLNAVGVVGRTEKAATARELGAASVIDKSTDDLWRAAERLSPRGYDVVLDANGASTLRQSYAHLKPTGRLVIYGFHSMLRRGRGTPSWPKLAIDWVRTPRFNPLDMTNDNKSVMAFNLSYLFDEKQLLVESMAELTSLVRAGAIQPLGVTTYPFAKVADAHRSIETGGTTGKLVLVV